MNYKDVEPKISSAFSSPASHVTHRRLAPLAEFTRFSRPPGRKPPPPNPTAVAAHLRHLRHNPPPTSPPPPPRSSAGASFVDV